VRIASKDNIGFKIKKCNIISDSDWVPKDNGKATFNDY
jgi:hypothetical protein